MIKSFLVLAKTSSFTEAARQSFFTQQAISKRIAKLEQELGTTLFIRLHNGVQLTPEGEVYYQAFKQAMDAIDQAQDKVNRMRERQEEHIRLGYLEMLIINESWNNFMQQFRSRYPELEIKIQTYSDGVLLQSLLRDDVDAAILFCDDKTMREQSLDCIKLHGHGDMLLCVNRAYPGAAQAASYMELQGITVFFPEQDKELAHRRMTEIGFSPECIQYRENISTALLAVNMLEGGILVGDHCEFRDNPSLRFFQVPAHPEHTGSTKLVWKKDNTKRSLRTMMEQFRSYYSQQEELDM
jgi:DNA-binding transcriptional LysR family regulator